jgi:hypothetical protein
MHEPETARTLRLFVSLLAVAAIGVGGARAATPEIDATVTPPAGSDALAPRLAATPDRLYLTWLEPVPDQEGAHRLRTSQRTMDGDWSPAVTIREGDDFFANWADVPGLAREPGGTLVAYWLQMLGEGTYSYGVHLARSGDEGRTWQDAGWLHDDTSPTEHGFVSMIPADEGLWAFWLDGREMEGGHGLGGPGAMTLRWTTIREGRPAPSALLDERTCECCDTAAARTTDGPVVVYRDRSAEEVRDVALVRVGRDPSSPAPVHADGWQIAGCPVNGPSVSALGERVGVVWFTAAGERSRVQAAFSEDGGRAFGAPVVLDDARPIGRVSTARTGDGDLFASWLARSDTGGELRLARVGPDGIRGKPWAVAATSAERSAGVPRLAAFGGALWLAWVEERFGEPARLRVARVDPSAAAAQAQE